MSNFKILPNGDRIYLGKAPEVIPFYTRDQKNKNLFHLDIVDCIHREMKPYITPCKKKKMELWCKKLCKSINVHICNSCEFVED